MNGFSDPPLSSPERNLEVKEEAEEEEPAPLPLPPAASAPAPPPRDPTLLLCYACSKVYKNKYYWRQHLIKKHLLCDPVPLRCDICFRAFDSGESFNQHLLIISCRLKSIEEAKKAVAVRKAKKSKKKSLAEQQQQQLEAEQQPLETVDSLALAERRVQRGEGMDLSEVPVYSQEN